MTKKDIRDIIDNLGIWSRGGQRAPHKPLLVLYALGRLLRGEDRLVPYSVVHDVLRKLLIEFGPHRQSYHPEYPFWWLQNDGIWQLTNIEQVETRKGHSDAKKSELFKYNVHGGFPQEVHSLLKKDKSYAVKLGMRLLEAHFPETLHEDILQAVSIDRKVLKTEKAKRDPEFRDKVLRAYEYQCVVCGFDVRLGMSHLALEAAHIKWHQAGGPDIEANGLALCALHHKLFDRGAFTITESIKMVVSERAHGRVGFNEWLMDFHGRSLHKPQRLKYYPETMFIRWHAREVFQGPSRYV